MATEQQRNPESALKSRYERKFPGKSVSKKDFAGAAQVDFERVIWAVDPDPDQGNMNRLAAQAVKPLATGAQILPIYAMDPEGLSWTGESAQERSRQLRPAAEAALSNALAEAKAATGLHGLLKPLILETDDVPVAGLARTLVRKVVARAERFGADLVLVSHHGRTGLSRILRTSFTELLLSESLLPVLAVTPHANAIGTYQDIVFPTDFSTESHHAFEQALLLARRMNARLRLFYKVLTSVDPVIQSGALILGGGWVALGGMVDSGEDERVKQGRRWAEIAAQQGVEIDFTPENSPASTSDAITRFCASSHNPLLVMTTIDSPLDAGFWGSVTRDVLGTSSCPVLVLRG